MTTVLDNFGHWKEFLGEHVDKAQAMGFSDEQIGNVAAKMGEFLANRVDPKNPEQRLLKELWDSGDTEERKTLARLMVKMADKAH
ncbi:MAG: DUF3243 domain-containing protein [Alicyclobacillaceae bacterium]|jgi:hypothetical protein|uniref:DUF3243 domain-containing protein n=1 Tax=Alicyclobacillus sp. SP_1 TaxID=2942475 RepID=UPI0021577F0F|nr:DUF3243 domain-containing protein [Alicyclobacillus sp. SP_1]MCY0897008.1 DUF3243 domain-containing protein [Alicyclobacillaceae bacterium]